MKVLITILTHLVYLTLRFLLLHLSDSCTPLDADAVCSVVDLTLAVYSGSKESSAAAEEQVYDEVLVDQVTAGTFVKDDIIAIRFYSKETKNSPVDSSTVSQDGSPSSSSQNSAESSNFYTIVISVLVTLAVVVAVVVGLIYRKRHAEGQSLENSIGNMGSDDDSRVDMGSSEGKDLYGRGSFRREEVPGEV